MFYFFFIMGAKRAIRLWGSDDILKYPNGDINTEILEQILEDASENNLDKSKLVLVTHEERVARFNPDNPRWKDVNYRFKLSYLFELYEKVTGSEYVIPSLKEKQKKISEGSSKNCLALTKRNYYQ